MVGAIFEAVFHAGITFSKVVPFLMPKKETANAGGNLYFSLFRNNIKESATNAKKVIYQLKTRSYLPPNEIHQGPINREACFYFPSEAEAIKIAKLKIKYEAIDSYEIRKFEEVFKQLQIGD